MASQREVSKQEWEGAANRDDINSGSLQRIADAVEKMASSYDNMRTERDRYQGYYKEQKQYKEAAQRENAALRGVITKLKKRLAAKPEEVAE